MSDESRSEMSEPKKLSKQDLKVETRNAFLIVTGLTVVFAFAVIQLFVIASYDTTLTLSGIKSLLSLDYASLVVLVASSWAWGLSIAQFWKLHKLNGSKT